MFRHLSISDFKSISPGFVLYALLGLTAAVYWPGLSDSLILDDYASLATLEEISSGHWSWWEFIWRNESGLLGRPVAMATFVFDYLTSGVVPAFKHTNLALHLLSGTLIFWLTGRLFNEIHDLRQGRWWLALWVAAMWLFSPLNVSTVLYVVQRMAQLAAFFCLLGLLGYVVGRRTMRFHYRRGMLLIVGSVLLCWPLAVFSKENGILLPLLMFVMELYWFGLRGDELTQRSLRYLFIGILGIPAATALFTAAAHPEWVLGGYIYRDFTLPERLLTETRVLWDYVAALLYPRGSQMGVFHDDFPASHGLWSPPSTALALLAWIAVAWTALRERMGWLGLILSGVVFFLCAQFLESTVFPLELYFEHRNYLPGVGIYITVAVMTGLLFRRLPGRQAALVGALLMLLPVMFAMAAYQRVLAWSSWDSILLTTAAGHPDSARAHSDLANWYAHRGDMKGFLDQIERVEQLSGGPSSASELQKAIAYCWTGTPLGEGFYTSLMRVQRLDMSMYTQTAVHYLADIADAKECGKEIDFPRLAATLERWYANSPLVKDEANLCKLHIDLARVFRRAGDTPAALAHLTDAMMILPTRLEAGLLMMRYLMESGDFASATRLLPLLKHRDDGKLKLYTQLLEQYEQFLSSSRHLVTPTLNKVPTAIPPPAH